MMKNTMIMIQLLYLFLGCKDSRNLSPNGFNPELRNAMIFQTPMEDKSDIGSYPVCFEYWFDGEMESVKKAMEFTVAIGSIYGGKAIQNCEEARPKAIAGCVEETLITNSPNSSDQEMFKNIKKMVSVKYYLGTDINHAKKNCEKGKANVKTSFSAFK